MSTKRYEKTFTELKEKNEGAFIPFVVLGDPDFETSKEILETMAKHADCLELGFPFSDPIADGKRIQAADERALNTKMNYEKCFELIKEVREKNPDLPIGLLLYYNLVYTNGVESFLKKAKESGVDGVLIADMPIEESDEIQELCNKFDLEQIFIIAPTTGKERMKKILSKAKGFVYTVSVTGVTGERQNVKDSTITLVKQIKEFAKIPICVGFGVSEPAHVKKILTAGADGAICGSAVETIIEKNLDNKSTMLKELDLFFEGMKKATKK